MKQTHPCLPIITAAIILAAIGGLTSPAAASSSDASIVFYVA